MRSAENMAIVGSGRVDAGRGCIPTHESHPSTGVTMPPSPSSRRAVAEWTIVLAVATAIAAEDFRVSLSVSPFAEFMFQRGVTFTDGVREAKNTEELQRMFVAHGATEVYARIGTRRKFTPGNGDH